MKREPEALSLLLVQFHDFSKSRKISWCRRFQNKMIHNIIQKKIPLICSKNFRFPSDYISIIDFYVSTVRLRHPDRKVLFDSFVKRKLRLPMSRGHVLFLEFFRTYSIKKMCYVHKNDYSRLLLLVQLRHFQNFLTWKVWSFLISCQSCPYIWIT